MARLKFSIKYSMILSFKIITIKAALFLIALLISYYSLFSQQVTNYHVDTNFKVDFNGLSTSYQGRIGDFIANNDGTIVAVGDFKHVFNNNLPRFCKKFNVNGTINSDFSFTIDNNSESNPNRIYKWNQYYYISISDDYPGLERLFEDGTIDTTFNIHYTFPGYAFFQTTDICVDSQGRVLLAGFFLKNGEPSYSLIRFNQDGSQDTTFKRIRSDFKNHMILPLPDNKYLIGGYACDTTFIRHGLWRIFNDGTLDTTFNTNATWGTTWQGILLPNGNILTVGNINIPLNQHNINLVRWKPNGSIDTSFKYFYSNDTNYIQCFTLQGATIIVGGHFNKLRNLNFHSIAAIDLFGNVDSLMFSENLGPDSATNNFQPAIYYLQNTLDGDIIASGAFTRFNGFGTFGLVRLNPLLVGINEPMLSKGVKFTVSPNPTNYTILIKLNYPKQGIITINDMTGKTLIIRNIYPNENLYNINVNDLSQGTYIIKVTEKQSNLSAHKQIVIVR